METTNSNANSHYKRLLDRLLLPFLLLLTPIIYLANARYNLPVSANVDERTSLEVLSHFHAGSLNPQFFEYPTLYYYVTYALTKPFSFTQILFWGRELNLAFVGLTAYLAYLFCRDNFKSQLAGLLSAGLIIMSPTIIESGSYLCTDVLLAVGVMASLLLLTRYFVEPSLRAWLLSMGAIGLAVGCKYTACLLFLVYVAGEVMWEFNKTGNPGSAPFATRIGRVPLISVVTLIAIALFLSGLLFPTAAAIRFAFAHHTVADQRSVADYVGFFDHIRALLVASGAFIFALAALIWKSELAFRLFSKTRIYLGIAIVLLVSLLTTPYSVITPAKFLYDLGALARSNILVSSGPMQWATYLQAVRQNESAIIVCVGMVALVAAAVKDFWRYRAVLLFSLIYILTIGFSRMGFTRYLTPILPVIFVFFGAAIASLLKKALSSRLVYARWLPIAVTIVGSVFLGSSLAQTRLANSRQSALWQRPFRRSYDLALELHPQEVLYAGYAPWIELKLAGLNVKQVSWTSLSRGAIGERMNNGQLLIYDVVGASDNSVSPLGDPTVQVLLNDPSGFGQLVLAKAGSPFFDATKVSYWAWKV